MQQQLLDPWARYQPTIFFITRDVTEAIFISDPLAIMSRRPGRIKLSVDVTEPKPVSFEFLRSLAQAALLSVQEDQ